MYIWVTPIVEKINRRIGASLQRFSDSLVPFINRCREHIIAHKDIDRIKAVCVARQQIAYLPRWEVLNLLSIGRNKWYIFLTGCWLIHYLKTLKIQFFRCRLSNSGI